ncbi:ASCH domain-containing protein [Lysobacter sp. M15]|uniref:ASCH domain-containing protein n=1 Tax=Lysobacter sp. M15 TaxID=2916837 RepID=UPI001F59C946|nr:ASCH domain-containing protein [Lysobacter sp. M15]
MRVLLSIKPEYAEKILMGQKHYEFRKVIPRAEGVKTVVIYATKPVGKVVGEFEIDSVLTEKPARLWSQTSNFSGISRRFFNEYFRGRAKGHAIKVKKATRYETPFELSMILSSGIAPQSFCYL